LKSQRSVPVRLRFSLFWPLVLLATTGAAVTSQVRVVDTDGNPVRAEVSVAGGSLTVTARGFLPWSGPSVPASASPVTVVLLRPACVRGRLVANGIGIGGVRLTIQAGGSGGVEIRAVTSDRRGIFELKDLPPTALRLALNADGYAPWERTLALLESETLWVDIEVRRTSTLRLKVTGPDGRAVRDAEARIGMEGIDDRILSATDRLRLSRLRAASDSQGNIAVGPLDRGVPHRVILRRDGFAPQSIRVVPEGDVIERQARLQRAGEIRLTLRDQEERPVAGGVAEPTSDDAPDLDLRDTPEPSGQDGLVILSGLPAGKYVLRVRAAGFRPATVREVEVRSGRKTDLGLIRLERGSSVAGRVVDQDDRPVEGASVRALFYEEGRRLAMGTESDIDGHFLVSGFPDEEVDVEVEASGFFSETLHGVRAASGEVRVVLSRLGRITGRVHDARSGLPIPAFSIQVAPLGRPAWPEATRWRTAGTPTDFQDVEGRFEVTGLRPQRYGLTVKARGYERSDLVEVDARVDSPESVDIRLDAGRTVEGTVLDAETGVPLAGAIVRPEDGDPVTADPDGYFRVGGLEGRTTLEAEHPSYVSKVMGGIDPKTSGAIEFRLSRGGSIEGTVYSPGGTAVPGAQIILEDGERTAVAGPAGRYRLEGVAPGGRYLRRMEASGSSEGAETALVTVRQGETTVYDFGRGKKLYGVVTKGGAPASGALIVLTPSGSTASTLFPVEEAAFTVRAREDGTYEVRGLRPGTYGLTLAWEGRTIAGRQARIEEATSDQRLDLQIPDVWIEGMIVDSDTGAGVRGMVTVAPVNSRTNGSIPQSQSESDASGRFRIPLMEPGTYWVAALAEGYTMEKALEVDVDSTRDDLRLEMVPAIELIVGATDSLTGAPLPPDCMSFFTSTGSTVACGADARLESLRPGDGVASVYVQGYAPGYQRVDLHDTRHEVAISLTRGGTLRLLLPSRIDSIHAARLKYGLRLENAAGIDVLAGRALLQSLDDPSAIHHVPAEHLRVRLGGGSSGVGERVAYVDIAEGGEAVADLR